MDIPQKDIEPLELEALSGSAEAARRLRSFYYMLKQDQERGIYWAQIEAENGGSVGEYTYGFYLSRSADPKARARARYWLRLAATNGDTLADSLLKEIGEK